MASSRHFAKYARAEAQAAKDQKAKEAREKREENAAAKIAVEKETKGPETFARYEEMITICLISKLDIKATNANKILNTFMANFPASLEDCYNTERLNFKDIFSPIFDKAKTFIHVQYPSFYKLPSSALLPQENRNLYLKGQGLPEEFFPTGLSIGGFIMGGKYYSNNKGEELVTRDIHRALYSKMVKFAKEIVESGIHNPLTVEHPPAPSVAISSSGWATEDDDNVIWSDEEREPDKLVKEEGDEEEEEDEGDDDGDSDYDN